jgi:3-methyladenine DNA glycosylase/8-oxoguanine DNA glycosylase
MISKQLRKRETFVLHPKPPFHFDGTFHKPSHFPAPVEAWKPGCYWLTIRQGPSLCGLRIQDEGSRNRPAIRISLFSDLGLADSDLGALKSELIWRFDLEADLSDFDAAALRDPRFRSVFRKWRGTRDSWHGTLYELLVISILLQNATVRRTVQMLQVLLDTFGTKVRFDVKSLFAIWRPEQLSEVSEEALRALKLGYRARFLKRLSEDFANGAVDEAKLRTLDLGTARKELTRLYGVGPETARILLYPACHQHERLSHIAPWQQKIYSRMFYEKPLVPARKILGDLNKRYETFASLATQYVWEDLFWRHQRKPIPWLATEIRL